MPPHQPSQSTEQFVRELGVADLPAATFPFDPGYDPVTLESHLEQSARFMAALKLSMTTWLIADQGATRRKLDAARRHRVAVITGGGPFEIAAAAGRLPEYLDLCAGLGFSDIEAGAGFTDLNLDPGSVVRLARERGLGVQYEVGKKGGGAFTDESVQDLVDEGQRWLDSGASRIVVEARESADTVGLFGTDGAFAAPLADRFAAALGLATVVFEAPTKASQFALLEHFGSSVLLGNVRLEELLRVEIYRRGLHADSFFSPRLSPSN